MADDRAIGVFDSGIGGLTVLAALARELPGESLVYLGDTARVPYGTRSPRTVLRYACQVADALVAHDVKALVVACNTATTHALPALQVAGRQLGLPVFGVIRPGVAEAVARTRTGHVGVLGTEGTVRGGRYQALLAQAGVRASAVACPLFVSLAEEGWHEGEIAEAVAQRYLGPLVGGPDTVILGCTHFPLMVDAIGRALPGVTLIDSASATAHAVAQGLAAEGRLTQGPRRAPRFLVTDNLERFRTVGTRFLGAAPEPVSLVDLVLGSGPFSEAAA